MRPALERLYGLLNDEQKARFDSLGPDNKNVAAQQPDLARLCSGRSANPAASLEGIERVLHLSNAQQIALDTLRDASAKAGNLLKDNCSADQSLTATGRLAAMESRLDAMLQAVKTVQPALEAFYNSLNDEQRAAFNQFGPQQG